MESHCPCEFGSLLQFVTVYYSMPILKVEVHSVSEVKMHCGVDWVGCGGRGTCVPLCAGEFQNNIVSFLQVP